MECHELSYLFLGGIAVLVAIGTLVIYWGFQEKAGQSKRRPTDG